MPTQTKRSRPRVGDECWEVEWCEKCAHDENGDHDFDRDKMAYRSFDREVEAQAFAVEIFPKCQHGNVAISPHRFEAYDDDDAIRYPHAGHWECTADPYFFEGEFNDDKTPYFNR